MITVEHRRHSMRVIPNQHLSQDGVTFARKVGERMGPFDRVVTSTLPRAFETAIAMGFAVDEQLDLLASWPEGIDNEVHWDEGFSRFAQVYRELPQGVLAQFVRQMSQCLREIIKAVPDGGRVLLISHGGIVEASAIGFAPFSTFENWGQAVSYCEGVRLYFDGSDCCGRSDPSCEPHLGDFLDPS